MSGILIQQVYPGHGFEKMLDLTKERHQAYCEKHHLTYRAVYDNVLDRDPKEGAWAKIKLILDAMDEGHPFVYWLDADTLIYDMDTPLFMAIETRKIGVCWQRIPQLHHWNVGALYIHNAEQTREFVKKWFASDKDPQWLEQGAFNKLARESKTVTTISDRWNATVNVSMVPDAVVLGFHGQGDADARYMLMKKYLEQIAKREGAKATPAHGVR